MSDEPSSVLDRLRQPQYTGANRCTPCTVLNVVLAAAGSLVLALVAAALAQPGFGVALAVTAFALALAAIYLRGYLVPGTPTLTERYLPDRVLSALGAAHEPDVADGWEDGDEDGVEGGDAGDTGDEDSHDSDGADDSDDGDDGDSAGDGPEFETLAKVERERRDGIEPATFLREVGAAVEIEAVAEDGDGVDDGPDDSGDGSDSSDDSGDHGGDGPDDPAPVPEGGKLTAGPGAAGGSTERDADALELTTEFRDRLRAELDRQQGATDDLATVGALFDAAADEVAPRDRDYPAFKVGARIRKWPSAAALRLDLAADGALADWSDRWPDVPVRHRDQTRQLVRSLAERCPDCGGELRATEQVVESCCRSGTVLGVDCADCGARVHESAA